MQPTLETLNAEMTAALTGLDREQTQARPMQHPEKWSLQQIVEHLLKTYELTLSVIQARLDKRSATRARPSLQQRIGQFLLIGMGRFPHGRGAPEAVTPGAVGVAKTGDELAGEVRNLLLQLDAMTRQGEALFGSRRAASHMVLGPLSMRQWCGFHLAHGRHHLKQIRAIRADQRL